MPAATWFVAVPVWIATHGHGCAVPQSALAVPGQLFPALMVYFGAQPPASSSLSCETAGSQSSDWFWLPPTTRRDTAGSLVEDARPRLPWTPTVTTRLCVQLVCTALQRSTELVRTPASLTCSERIGPERAVVALSARWTSPKVPTHLLPLPVLHALPFSVPFVSAQSIVTAIWPAPTATGIVVAVVQSRETLL